MRKKCPECGKYFGRYKNKSGSYRTPKEFARQIYCSNECKRLNRPAAPKTHPWRSYDYGNINNSIKSGFTPR